jgi:hypothetical protein
MKHITAVILIACGPTLDVHLGLSPGAPTDNQLFALQTVTSEQQSAAQEWISTHWVKKVNLQNKWGKAMPSFNTVKWWKFVGGFMRTTFGFGVERKRSHGAATVIHKLVPNGFWKAHRIDVVQVGLAHRLRTSTGEDAPHNSVYNAPIVHNDRPYGVLAERMRKCFRCPTSRSATKCVRQKGTEWLCSHPDTSLGHASRCHRDYHISIDTGYLDVEIPNDERKDAMIIEEIEDDSQTAEEQTLQDTLRMIDTQLATLPDTHRQLLEDMGYITGVYEVTADQMKQSWKSALDVDYLVSLELEHCAHNTQKLTTVRKAALKLLHNSNLDMSMQQRRDKGAKVVTYTVSVLS